MIQLMICSKQQVCNSELYRVLNELKTLNNKFENLIERRKQGEPIAYLTNKITGETCSYEAVLNTGKGLTSAVGLWITITPKTTGYCFYFQDRDYWSFLTT